MVWSTIVNQGKTASLSELLLLLIAVLLAVPFAGQAAVFDAATTYQCSPDNLIKVGDSLESIRARCPGIQPLSLTINHGPNEQANEIESWFYVKPVILQQQEGQAVTNKTTQQTNQKTKQITHQSTHFNQVFTDENNPLVIEFMGNRITGLRYQGEVLSKTSLCAKTPNQQAASSMIRLGQSKTHVMALCGQPKRIEAKKTESIQ